MALVPAGHEPAGMAAAHRPQPRDRQRAPSPARSPSRSLWRRTTTTSTAGWSRAPARRSRQTEKLIERLGPSPILAALAEFPQNFRDVVVYVDLAGLSYQEAADVLGIPIGTVMSRLHRGRRMIKTRLAEPVLAAGESES